MGLEGACMTTQPWEARNYFLACYAVSLAQGQTIQGNLIQAQTVWNYLKDAYELFNKQELSFTPDQGISYMLQWS